MVKIFSEYVHPWVDDGVRGFRIRVGADTGDGFLSVRYIFIESDEREDAVVQLRDCVSSMLFEGVRPGPSGPVADRCKGVTFFMPGVLN